MNRSHVARVATLSLAGAALGGPAVAHAATSIPLVLDHASGTRAAGMNGSADLTCGTVISAQLHADNPASKDKMFMMLRVRLQAAGTTPTGGSAWKAVGTNERRTPDLRRGHPSANSKVRVAVDSGTRADLQGQRVRLEYRIVWKVDHANRPDTAVYTAEGHSTTTCLVPQQGITPGSIGVGSG